jgi:hypothetical protein
VVARLLLLAALLPGCGAPCRESCQHLIRDCGFDRPGLDVDECTRRCEAYLDHYEDAWQEEQSRASVRCVREASCETLSAGGTPCYDAAVYVW